MTIPEDLRAGDVMFYRPCAWYSRLICALSGGWTSHVEVYYGKGLSIAARPYGVNIYASRVDRYLASIRRPGFAYFDASGGWLAIKHDIGKPYEFKALPRFFQYWRRSRHVARVCSPIATKFLMGGGCNPFQPRADLSRVSPYDLWASTALYTIWGR
jgi:hypothetical protein